MSLIQTNAIPPDQRSRWILAYLRHSPFALCLREINRLLALESLTGVTALGKDDRVLDVGCGDGFWWTLIRDNCKDVYGIDVSASELSEAARRIHVERVDISQQVPFSGVRFAAVIGNCSLEHVRDINAALRNMRACAQHEGRLILFVPTPQWSYQGHMQTYLLRHAPRLAMLWSGALNGFFQHWHLYDSDVWSAILTRNGWYPREVHGLGNDRSELLFRLFLPLSFAGFVFKKVFGIYPNRVLGLAPDWLLAPCHGLLEWALKDPILRADHPKAYEYMIIATAGSDDGRTA